MQHMASLLAASLAVTGAAGSVLQHLGGNAQWLPGPEVTAISSDIPSGCKVDLAAFFSRHGSRYPDTGAYAEWTSLYQRLQASAPLQVNDTKLDFLKTWKPVLSHPERQIAQLSPTGYKELHEMGSTWRLRYPDLYEYNTPFTMWANWYKSSPRVRDSARLFAQGFLGPNATELATIYALNSSDPRSWMNSLATSDLCTAYADEGGSPYKDEWDDVYLPPIRARLNAKIRGDFNFTEQDVSIIPYLCGFETQITGRQSPFCDILTEDEILQYEYAQDLRYWYGTGLGSDIEKYQMLPVVDMVTRRFKDGPDVIYENGNSTFSPPKIMASFSNDGQINQIIAATGVFDGEPQLPGDRILPNRLFRASRLTPMRGTVAFERLSCSPSSTYTSYAYPQGRSNNQTYMRIRFNEVVYPVFGCTSGPGSSCPLSQYEAIIGKKLTTAGSLTKLCNTTNPSFSGQPRADFFMNSRLPFATVIKP
ncbi:acid phosphatase-like protein [Plenodomus tracheiphilus IPT5]|uniref:Acid phosphatase-like protein n=1 Tax=Plenodomus tracheiphilus IPT5 TaxID=1408161 RepID=A0A6A7AQF6_9PLEO|nr:acid phosphatase-like protein [Plenodomus tracheiphilus IPT5]